LQIPHDFGRSAPPLIGNIENVKTKMQLMDALLNLEIANNLMRDNEKLAEHDPIIQNYKALKSKITPLEKEGDLYKILERYAYSTHDKVGSRIGDK
jgi:poly [ADP-ribose] polymerase